MDSVVYKYATTLPLAILKQQWHTREAPLIECEWAFRIKYVLST